MVKKDKPAQNTAENIKVIVRCRPLNEKERTSGYKSCVDLNLGDATVQVNHVVGEPDRWTFDAVVNNTYAQKDVFTQFIMPLIDSVMDGFNATVFAYGQSGSGKTHTMTGKLDDEDLKGIIPRTFEYVFSCIREQQRSSPGRTFSLSCTFVELYNGKIHDLLAKQQVPLAVKENKDKTFFVQGVHSPQVKFADDLVRHMEEGTDRRRVAATDLNADSSRSHSLFTLSVDMVETDDEGTTRSVTSKFNLVDLAGSERQSKTGAAGDTLKEGCNINLSLSALGTVIDTLVKGKGHVPFRSSPLTMLLKDSLGGSSKTVMFANIGPSEHNLSETVSTLRFADRAKQIKNKPVVNMDSKDQKIQELTEQVNELREKLKQFESVGVQKMEEQIEELRTRVGELEVDLENAVKGREADNLESMSKIEHSAAELAASVETCAELKASVNQLQVEANLLEEQIRDERRQRDEIWSSCTAQCGCDITSVDELLSRIQALANSVPMEEHVRVTSDLRSLTATLDAERQSRVDEVTGLKGELAAALEELESVQKKLEKTKEKLEKEKDARKLMLTESSDTALHRTVSDVAHTSPSAAWMAHKHELEREHAAAVNALTMELEDVRKRASEGTEVTELRSELAALSQRHQTQVCDLERQMAALVHDVSIPTEGDGPAVEHLKRIIEQREAALRGSQDTIHALQAEVERLLHGTQSRNVEKDAKSPSRNRKSKENSAVKQPHAALHDELKVTADHRDDLLKHVINGTNAESSVEIARLTEENARLRAQSAELMQQISASHHAQGEKEDLDAAHAALEQARLEAAQVGPLQSEILRLEEVLRSAAQTNEEHEAALLAKLSAASGDAALSEVVESLRQEKIAAQQEVMRLQKDMRAIEAQVTANTSEHQAVLHAEIHRLRALVNAPRAGDDSESAALREELQRREEMMVKMESDFRTASSTANQQATNSEETRHTLHVQQSQIQMLELERTELAEQLDALRSELDEAVEKREAAKKDNTTLTAEFNARGAELSEAKIHAAALQNRISELTAELERAATDSATFNATVESLNARLKERTDQMAELRKTIEQVKELAETHKHRAEQLKGVIAEKQKELAEKDIAHMRAKEEQEVAFQRMMTRRLEVLTEEHKKALQRKDDDISAVRKKTKKIEEKLEKLKEKYDSKVYEYEELVSRMEEQKFEAMRNLRDRDVVVIEEGQGMVQDALKAAKESQRRRADMFATGEVQSMVASVRPAGSAVVAARNRGGGGHTPPAEEVVTTSRRSPRPAGYGVGRAVVSVEAPPRSGGAGYSSYVPEPPPRAANRPLNGGFEMVPDEYLDTRGNGAGGDIYDF